MCVMAYKKSAEMRKNILEATKHVVKENGYTKTAIKDVADYLGVPRSLVYYYFKNKESIMQVLFREAFQVVEQVVSTVLPRGQEPMVRLMLKYLMYRRMILLNSLFIEFVVASEFATLDVSASADQIERYYSDSQDAFVYRGKPVDGKEFRIHVRMVEGVGRAMVVGEYYGTIKLDDREFMDCLGKYAIMPTFDLTKKEMEEILDRTFVLAELIEKSRMNESAGA